MFGSAEDLDVREHGSPDETLVTDTREGEAERVREWRLDRATRQGYDAETAARIAGDGSVDQHLIDRLLGAGCTPELALRVA